MVKKADGADIPQGDQGQGPAKTESVAKPLLAEVEALKAKILEVKDQIGSDISKTELSNAAATCDTLTSLVNKAIVAD